MNALQAMFKRLINRYILNQVAKYEPLPLCQQPIDFLHVQIGQYGAGLQRIADILLDEDTTEKFDLIQAKLYFNEQSDLTLIGTRKDNGITIEKIIKKEDISWHRSIHTEALGVDEEYELCSNPNEGMFDIQLKNRESIVLHYVLEKSKEFKLIA